MVSETRCVFSPVTDRIDLVLLACLSVVEVLIGTRFAFSALAPSTPQLEHYVFCVYIAVLMDANGVITDGFTGSGHRGGEEYHTIAGALGVDLNLTQASARARHAPNVTWGTVDHLDLVNAMARSEAARRGESLHPCYAWIVTDVRGCHHEHGDWCDDQYGSFLNFLGSYGWLRNNRVKEECFERKLGFSDRGPAGDTVHIAWHVRNGDRCLHCEDISARSSALGARAPLARRARQSTAASLVTTDAPPLIIPPPLPPRATVFQEGLRPPPRRPVHPALEPPRVRQPRPRRRARPLKLPPGGDVRGAPLDAVPPLNGLPLRHGGRPGGLRLVAAAVRRGVPPAALAARRGGAPQGGGNGERHALLPPLLQAPRGAAD